jgi:hypothetical protein
MTVKGLISLLRFWLAQYGQIVAVRSRLRYPQYVIDGNGPFPMIGWFDPHQVVRFDC